MTHYRTCNLCEAMCGIAIDLDRDGALRIRGDAQDPFSRGHVCPKALSLAELQQDPDRLREPLVRRPDGSFAKVSWAEAFDAAARGLQAVRARHGRDAIALYRGNPVAHQYGTTLGSELLAAALGTTQRFSSHSLDGLPPMLAAYRMFGHPLLMPVPDLDRTEYVLMLGANPMVSNGSIMSAPGIGKRLAALRARRGKLVVFDPRRTETAKIACEHHFLRPGTDALVLLGLLHTLFEEGLTRLPANVHGRRELRHACARFSPERVAPVVHLAATELRRIAREFAAAPAAVCYGRMGACTQEFGATTAWLINVVNVVTGNVDRPGGAMFTTPAFDLMKAASLLGGKGSFDTARSRVRGLPEFGGEFPAATLAEEILEPGAGQVRALVTLAGNPALSVPGGERMRAALASLEFFVAVDYYRNETTCHADVILPPVGPLERDQYNAVFNAYAVRNVARYAEPLLHPAKDAQTDWSILLELALRLAIGPTAARLTQRLRRLAHTRSPSAIIELGLRAGAYPRLSLAVLKANPHGLDLGPLKPALAERLATRSGAIELATAGYADELARLDRRAEAPIDRDALLLIGRRELRSNNSWMHNAPRLMRGRDRCTLFIHPLDAAARGLAEGAQAQLRTEGGSPVQLAVHLTEDLMPGVVSMPHGYGHHAAGARLQVAGQRPGVSMNDVLDASRVDALSGTAQLNGVAVIVEAAALAAPASAGGGAADAAAPGG